MRLPTNIVIHTTYIHVIYVIIILLYYIIILDAEHKPKNSKPLEAFVLEVTFDAKCKVRKSYGNSSNKMIRLSTKIGWLEYYELRA